MTTAEIEALVEAVERLDRAVGALLAVEGAETDPAVEDEVRTARSVLFAALIPTRQRSPAAPPARPTPAPAPARAPSGYSCPLCGEDMASRTNRQTGEAFWGCRDYPRCKGTRNSDGEAPTRRGREDQLPSDRQRSNDRRRW